MWSTVMCDTITGRRLATLEPVSCSGERKMNGIGTGSHTFVTSSIGAGATVDARRAARRDLLTPWARTLVQCWDGQPRYAGLLLNPVVNRDKGTVTVGHTEARELWKHRTTFGTNGYSGNIEDGKLPVLNKSLAAIAGWLIHVSLEGPAANWSMPFVLPDRDASGTNSRTWYDYNLPIIDSELTEIQDSEGGPDIDLVPRWSADGSLEWVIRVGALTGPTLDWNLSVPEPALTGVTSTLDGAKQSTVLYATGDGQEVDLLVRTARATSATVPALERIESYSQLEDLKALQGHANEDLATFRTPTTQYSMSMQADGTPGVADLVLGQKLRTYTADDDWFDDGWDAHRLIGYSFDLSNTITLQLQPERA
jgi:hypothetical protein